MSDIPENIIIKYLQNRATIVEIEALNQWLDEDEKHTHLFYQMQVIWDSGKVLPPIEIAEKWDRLYFQIQDELNEKSTIIELPNDKSISLNSRIKQWMQYAAVFAIGIIITIIWNQFHADLPTQIAMLNHVVYNHQGSQRLKLPDQSSVLLGDNSQITYPEQFDNKVRLVSLKGKAYFDIQKKEQAFIVKTENIEIKVTGTEFEVDNSTKKGLVVSLVSGKVDIYTKNESGVSVSFTHLISGQQACISKDGKLYVEKFDTNYVLAWKDGFYRFTNEPIENVINLISTHYHIKIQISEKLKGKHFTGRITPDMDLQEVMKIIDMSHPISYSVTSEGVFISEK